MDLTAIAEQLQAISLKSEDSIIGAQVNSNDEQPCSFCDHWFLPTNMEMLYKRSDPNNDERWCQKCIAKKLGSKYIPSSKDFNLLAQPSWNVPISSAQRKGRQIKPPKTRRCSGCDQEEHDCDWEFNAVCGMCTEDLGCDECSGEAGAFCVSCNVFGCYDCGLCNLCDCCGESYCKKCDGMESNSTSFGKTCSLCAEYDSESTGLESTFDGDEDY
jgi:hypothetical protein